MKNLICLALFVLLSVPMNAQKTSGNALFDDQTALNLKFTSSIKDIKKKTNDSTYLPSTLYIQNAAGGWDSIKMQVRARGIFRRKNCYFAPIRIKISKENAKGTLFAENRSLKLVMPCENSSDKDQFVIKEYMCYKMFEKITPYTFSTRMVKLDFTEQDGKKIKNHQVTAFLIEDDDIVAKRHNATIKEKMNLHPMRLSDTSSIKHDMFQYMIGNVDWSTTFEHNAKVMFTPPSRYIPLAYDFDISGFVNPPYAVPNEDIGQTDVRDRVYRGFCRQEGPMQAVRQIYLAKEPEVMGVMAQYEKDFPPRDYTDMKKYIEKFYAILKSNSDFKERILDGCRKK